MKNHPKYKMISKYYRGCNTQNAALMISTFTGDVIHYFVDHSAISGAEGLANYWCKVATLTKASWTIDHILVKGEEAVIEWSMRWKPASEKKYELLRGTEWFIFRENRIAEIRSYHCNFFRSDRANCQLHDFDYSGRGYSVLSRG